MTTTYVKPDNKDEIQRLIQGLDVCRKYADSNRLDGVIFFADCNARYFYWGDHFCNQLGHGLIIILPIFSILNDGELTFRSINGYSVIDLCICYGNFINKYDWNLTIDEGTELFTGPPSRGHFPVKFTIEKPVRLKVNEEPWIEKALRLMDKPYGKPNFGLF